MSGSLFQAFGHLAVAEHRYDTSNFPHRETDLLVLVSGWERRGSYVLEQLRVKSRSVLFLDFDLSGLEKEIDQADLKDGIVNRERVEQYCRLNGISDYLHVKLADSTDHKQNSEIIDRSFSMFQTKGIRSVYIEATLVPRIYLHYMIGCLLKRSIVPILDIGYHEGAYDGIADAASLANGKFSFVNVPIFPGSGGTSQEKYFVIGLGGDEALFYDLHQSRAPGHVFLLTGLDDRYPKIIELLKTQIRTATQTFRIDEGEIFNSTAFSVVGYLTSLWSIGSKAGSMDSINIFVSGPRPQAVAAAIFACVDGRVSIIGRVPHKYTVRNNMPGTTYWTFRIADLANTDLTRGSPLVFDLPETSTPTEEL